MDCERGELSRCLKYLVHVERVQSLSICWLGGWGGLCSITCVWLIVKCCNWTRARVSALAVLLDSVRFINRRQKQNVKKLIAFVVVFISFCGDWCELLVLLPCGWPVWRIRLRQVTEKLERTKVSAIAEKLARICVSASGAIKKNCNSSNRASKEVLVHFCKLFPRIFFLWI